MEDDKIKCDAHDRSRIAGDEGYEVEYFARKDGLSGHQARALIQTVGTV